MFQLEYVLAAFLAVASIIINSGTFFWLCKFNWWVSVIFFNLPGFPKSTNTYIILSVHSAFPYSSTCSSYPCKYCVFVDNLTSTIVLSPPQLTLKSMGPLPYPVKPRRIFFSMRRFTNTNIVTATLIPHLRFQQPDQHSIRREPFHIPQPGFHKPLCVPRLFQHDFHARDLTPEAVHG